MKTIILIASLLVGLVLIVLKRKTFKKKHGELVDYIIAILLIIISIISTQYFDDIDDVRKEKELVLKILENSQLELKTVHTLMESRVNDTDSMKSTEQYLRLMRNYPFPIPSNFMNLNNEKNIMASTTRGFRRYVNGSQQNLTTLRNWATDSLSITGANIVVNAYTNELKFALDIVQFEMDLMNNKYDSIQYVQNILLALEALKTRNEEIKRRFPQDKEAGFNYTKPK